ncbi:MAG: AAA family ATPase [Acetobacteraceae bacterium]
MPTTTEHRFLTVLFCDMMDSSGQLFRLGPEAFETVLTAYRHVAFEQIRRHGGHVARVIGDGIVATFGWPRAGGRDAQSAVTCALEIGAQLERLGEQTGPALEVCPAARMAVETGWVLIGEIGPRNEAEHDGIIGQAPNIAARLQQVARRNGVVVGEGTLPLLRDGFVTEPAETDHLNLPAPIRAAHILGHAHREDPLGRLRALARTPLVDREAEMRSLRQGWRAAAGGQGRMVLLSGEAGMGKSRLLTGFTETLDPEPHGIVAMFCAEHMADSPLHPLIAPVAAALNLSAHTPAEEIAARAAEFVAALGLPRDQAGTALAALLGAPLPANAPSATEIRRWTFDALLAWFDTLAAQGPLLALVEDLHWADASLLEFLRLLGNRISQKRLLLVATHRPEIMPDWPDWPHLMRIALGSLPSDACHAIAASVAGELDEITRTAIVERAEGVPLFVEEFTRALADRSTPDGRLPGSISQLLLSRLDSLGPARGAAQLAAVFGSQVTTGLLAELSDVDRGSFEELAARLVDSGVMARRHVGDEVVLEFRHALLAQAAYQALPTAGRRAAHRRIAERLVRAGRNSIVIEPEVLGRHLELADDAAAATVQFRRAAESALAAGAFVEAERHARRAIRLAEALTDETRPRAILSARILLGEALIATLGYANEQVLAVFEQATEVAFALGEARELLPVLRGLTAFYQVRGPLHRALELGARMLHLARQEGDELLLAEAERRQGWCQLCRGQLVPARALLDGALARVGGAEPALVAAAPVDTSVMALANLSLLAWFVEGDDAARRRACLTVDHATVSSRPIGTAYGLGIAAIVHQLAGDAGDAHRLALRAGDIASARGIVYWSALAQVLLGWAETMSGKTESGLNRLRAGIAGYRRTQGEILRPYALILLAEALEGSGRQDEALVALDEAEQVSETIEARMYIPLLGWVRGRLLARIGDPRAAAILAASRIAAEGQGAGALAGRILRTSESLPARCLHPIESA